MATSSTHSQPTLDSGVSSDRFVVSVSDLVNIINYAITVDGVDSHITEDRVGDFLRHFTVPTWEQSAPRVGPTSSNASHHRDRSYGPFGTVRQNHGASTGEPDSCRTNLPLPDRPENPGPDQLATLSLNLERSCALDDPQLRASGRSPTIRPTTPPSQPSQIAGNGGQPQARHPSPPARPPLSRTRSLLLMLTALRKEPIPNALELLLDLEKPRHTIASIAKTVIKEGSTAATVPSKDQLLLNSSFQSLDNSIAFDIAALLDSGASDCYIDKDYAYLNNLHLDYLAHPVSVFNADGSENDSGQIVATCTVLMKIQDHIERVRLYVVSIAHPVIIGFSWLRRHNPEIDWRNGDILFRRCPRECAEPSPWIHQDIYEFINPDSPLDYRKIVQQFDLEDDEKVLMVPDINHLILRILSSSENPSNAIEDFLESVPPDLRDEFRDVFSKAVFDELPPHRDCDHAIEFTQEARAFVAKPYMMTPAEQPALDNWLKEEIAALRIRPSKSPVASPMFFVKKKDGTLRPVQDYRRLNSYTVRNRYPIPKISEILNKLKGAKYFTKLDIRWGFNNVRIKEGDEWKAAFITNRGLFEPLVMYFGLTNSPATFQSMMDELFIIPIQDGYLIIYMDDLLIFSDSLDRLIEHEHAVLSIMKQHRLSAKPEKCVWRQTRVEYLGLIISEDGVEMDPKKTSAILEWPTPSNKKELQQFLGLANYYRKFMPHFAHIASPLHNLTGNVSWEWTPQHAIAFDNLKATLSSDTVLAFPTDDDPVKNGAPSPSTRKRSTPSNATTTSTTANFSAS
ncbi:hypothetical protein NMY22_g11055 [Coprinellus aureogranulatus]|nr:hypothetical protein NMY22_g11055 [Coprinellus aureogranulatus]